ncbi:hypothetical protein B0H21DRAFT_759098 [Amylocystis lapponica]|nr:hypothetical protein B0H21DRAFT_774345 [Amylocystis lapponica]KAH9935847.1 hypothetical protein B0H21DRAFT_759098 [Amylocystis lapponica]
MPAPYVVAIAGASGNLGSEIIKVFLASYRSSFSRIIALVRNPSSDGAKALAEAGAELYKIDDANLGTSYEKALSGVDALVNVLGKVPTNVKDTIFDAAVKAGVKVYFPSEFGINHLISDFPGWDNKEWTRKRAHLHGSLEAGKGRIKTVAVFNGLFIEDTFGPWFGFDTANHVYTSVGAPTTRFSLTSKTDVGRALGALSLVALADPSKVPDTVSICSATVSHAEVAEIVQRVRKELGDADQEEIVVKSVDLAAFREATRGAQLSNPDGTDPAGHIRIVMGEGKLDFSKTNANEIANPGQKTWKWKTVEEYMREVKGHPWC